MNWHTCIAINDITIQLTLDFVWRNETLQRTRLAPCGNVWKNVLESVRIVFRSIYSMFWLFGTRHSCVAHSTKVMLCTTHADRPVMTNDEKKNKRKNQYHAQIDFISHVSQYRTKCFRKMHFYGIVSPCAWPLWWIYSFRRRQPRAFVIESEGSLSQLLCSNDRSVNGVKFYRFGLRI